MGPGFESLKVHQADLAGVPDAVHQLERAEEGTRTWPVGQVVKTEASHAFNIGSIPVRVIFAPLAQLVEQLTLNQWAQGSSPWRCTRY